MSNQLNLTLIERWFLMTLSGEKPEEYREVKPYWISSLILYDEAFSEQSFRTFDTIQFTNGYGKHRPSFTIECNGISIGKGNPAWGAPPEDVFIISLGRVLTTKNIK